AVAEVQRDDGRFVARHSGELAPPVGYVPVGSSVEAVAPYLVAPVHLVRNRVEKRALGERVVERRVEHGNLRNSGAEGCARGLDAAKVRGIVQRRQVYVVLYA